MFSPLTRYIGKIYEYCIYRIQKRPETLPFAFTYNRETRGCNIFVPTPEIQFGGSDEFK